jgi:ankyrin repeat protein
LQAGPSLTAPSDDIAKIKALSDNGFDINNKKTYFQALDWASKEGKVPIVRLLLERGTDVNAHNEHGETTLCYACKNGFEDIAGRLLDQGADIKVRGRYRAIILNYAIEHEAVLRLLLDRGADTEPPGNDKTPPLVDAADRNYPAAVRILLQRGANMEGMTPTKEKALHLASRSGNLEIVRLLLDAGDKINEPHSNTACTALIYAAIRGHVEVIRLLLERGADPKLKDKRKMNALDTAKEGKHLEAVKVLKAARTGLFRS